MREKGADAGNAGGKWLTLQDNQRQKSGEAETHGSHGGEGGQGSSRWIGIEDVGDQRSEDRLISPDINQSTNHRARPPDSRARRPANPKEGSRDSNTTEHSRVQSVFDGHHAGVTSLDGARSRKSVKNDGSCGS